MLKFMGKIFTHICQMWEQVGEWVRSTIWLIYKHFLEHPRDPFDTILPREVISS